MKKILINIILFFIFFEIGSFILSKFNLLTFNQTPEFYWNEKQVKFSNFFTEKNEWGAWHKPNSTTFHKSQCFDAKYTSNEIGAKDSSFKNIKNKKDNIVILGDSFAEGHGSNNDDDFETILEKKIGKNILNFASSGDLGPLQYWIIYNKIASNYSHNKVIIALATGNDFSDNNYAFWESNSLIAGDDFFKKRYRPYYFLNSDGTYDFFIPETAYERDYISYPQKNLILRNIKEFIKKYFWSSNTLRSIKLIIVKNKQINNFNLDSKDTFSGYFDAELNDQKAAVYFIEKIIDDSFPRDVLLISIPRPQDFLKLELKKNELKNIYWHKYLKEKDQLDERFTFIDILDFPPQNIFDLYFTCDGHLSKYGNEWIANILYSKLNFE